MPVPPADHSSSIDSTSSFSSSKSSLLALPIDEVSSQSDVADSASASMPQSDIVVYNVADHPEPAAFHFSTTAVSTTTQKFKRAFAKRRRPSRDAGTVLSSGDEQYASDFGPSPSACIPSSSSAIGQSPANRSPAGKLTMHLFGGRKHHGTHHGPPMSTASLPPPLPPKPVTPRALPPPPSVQMLAPASAIHSLNVTGSRSRNSVMTTSPAITAAIEIMREDEERQRVIERQRELISTDSQQDAAEDKENWRKSDSTMDSGHTVRPADVGSGASKRFSTVLTTPAEGGNMDILDVPMGAPDPEGPWQDKRPVENTPHGRHSKRRSLSLNIHIPTTVTPSPPRVLPATSVPSTDPYHQTMHLSTTDPVSGHSAIPFSSSRQDAPPIAQTAGGIHDSNATSIVPVPKTTIRSRLAAWTATTNNSHQSRSPLSAATASTSSPSLTAPLTTPVYPPPRRRLPVSSDASQPSSEMQALAAVRQLQNRMRSPSSSSTTSTVGIRQAATSLTSGAGAMALGLGKRAYEKVGRVWNNSQSGSGSGSDTPSQRHPSPVGSMPGGYTHPSYYPGHAPSSYPVQGRRTPNAPSGAWSVSSAGGSRSSSEKDHALSMSDPTPPSTGALGRLVRPPRGNTGGIVFGRELWECVKDTRAVITGSTQDPLTTRMIPALVYRCAQHLRRWGIEEEGLFRISGRSSHIARLRNEFDGGADYDITDCSPSELDPHAVASVFKAYLRELPEPILTRALGSLFDAAINAENSRAAPSSSRGIISKHYNGGVSYLPTSPTDTPMLRKPPSLSTFTLPTSASLRSPSLTLIETLSDLISRLPLENRDLLLTVVELMKATAARSKETKMPLSNLLLVFCPSLGMPPTLLRAFCDVPSIWERKPQPVDVPKAQAQETDEDSSDDSTSETDFEAENQQVVVLPARKGKEKELPIMESPSKDPHTVSMPEAENPQSDIVTDPLPISRPLRGVRRVPIPALFIDNQQMDSSLLTGPHTAPPANDPLPRSVSTPSLEIPDRSQTPSSPMLSEASLNFPSEPSNPVVVSSDANNQFISSSLPSTGFVSLTTWAPPNHNKSLPASPRSPTIPTGEVQAVQIFPQLDTSQIPGPESGPKQLGSDLPKSSPPQAWLSKDAYPERSSSLPTPRLLASKSAPDVVFPSSAKTTPSTPTSSKKHNLTLSLGRSPKLSVDDLPSPSKRIIRRPSLNMLFNMKRTGSPSPMPRTPVISTPCSSPVSLDYVSAPVERSPKILTNPFPPVLSLPIESNLGVGLGWDEVFNGSEVPVAAVQPRPITVSQPSAQPPWTPAPPSSPRRPTTEYLTSSNGLFGMMSSSSAPPVANPGVETSDTGSAKPSPPGGLVTVDSREDDWYDETPTIGPRMNEAMSPPPHISFQLRRSSLEEEDWASAVLLAAGRQEESFA